MNYIRTAMLLAALTALFMGLGAMIGDGAVIDHQFHTTDVCIVVKTDLVTDKYYKHYERKERRPVLAYSTS